MVVIPMTSTVFARAYYQGGDIEPKALAFGELEIESFPGKFNREIIQVIGGDYRRGTKIGPDNIVIGDIINTSGFPIE